MTYRRFEVVVVPFPFTDSTATKRRPALVLSDEVFNAQAGHSVMAMITSAGNASWPLDVALADLQPAGLPAPSMVRMKLFTLDHRFVVRRAGKLSAKDGKAVAEALHRLLA